MSIDDAIRAAEEAAQKRRDALNVLEREAVAESGVVRLAVEQMKKRAADVASGGVRRALAEERRPKGPQVTLEFASFYASSREVLPGEVVRRTATQVVVRRKMQDGHYSADDYYKLADGKPARSGASGFNGYWRIREADLPTIRAMRTGENAVSRALKAIEAGRYDEVKP
ncbi:hypothetical protein [Sorangium sp. So ce124]|uniref:hypothetical protein n=1 Tax=Sorangium sp. So ce124 TaxID=3133280 RepID=UPI003F5F970C